MNKRWILWTLMLMAGETSAAPQYHGLFPLGGGVGGGYDFLVYETPFFRVHNVSAVAGTYLPTPYLPQQPVYIPDGADNPRSNFYLIVPRDPFFRYFNQPTETTTPSSCGTAPSLVLITYPLNGSTFIMPSITPNVTVTIVGLEPGGRCLYRVGGAWNNFTHCQEGVNTTFDRITLPQGYPLTLEVNITNGCASTVNRTQLTVIYANPGAEGYMIRSSILLGLAAVLFFVIAEDSSRRRLRS